MRKLMALLLSLSMVFFTGCFDKKELNEIGIITGVAVDKDIQNGQYILTIQVVVPANLAKETKGKEKPYKNVSAEGYTIDNAEYNISKIYDRVLFFSHNRIILVDENVAKEGLIHVLDFFTRDIQSRDKVFLAVAKDVQARQILDYNDKTEQIPSIGLSNYQNVLFCNSGSVYKTVLDFNQSILSYGSNPVLGVFSLSPKIDDQPEGSDTQGNEYQFAGSAVFNYDSLQGFLSPGETEAYNFATGNIKSAEIDINGLKNTDALISTQVIHESSSIVPHFDGSQISFDINIQDTAIIGEVHDETDVTDLDSIAILENEHAEKVKNQVEELIQKLQTEYKSDILGLGQNFYKKYPKQWEKIKTDWSEIFPDIGCNVTVKTLLTNSGVNNKKNKNPD